MRLEIQCFLSDMKIWKVNSFGTQKGSRAGSQIHFNLYTRRAEKNSTEKKNFHKQSRRNLVHCQASDLSLRAFSTSNRISYTFVPNMTFHLLHSAESSTLLGLWKSFATFFSCFVQIFSIIFPNMRTTSSRSPQLSQFKSTRREFRLHIITSHSSSPKRIENSKSQREHSQSTGCRQISVLSSWRLPQIAAMSSKMNMKGFFCPS